MGWVSGPELDAHAKRIKELSGCPLLEIMSELTAIERQITDADAHRAVALAKQVLTGKRPLEDLTLQVQRLQGLV